MQRKYNPAVSAAVRPRLKVFLAPVGFMPQGSTKGNDSRVAAPKRFSTLASLTQGRDQHILNGDSVFVSGGRYVRWLSTICGALA